MTDDGSTTVALPEVPLLAVLPGTGGLTRVTDKRKVRRDLADVFCSTEEGVKGRRAVDWRLVDEVVPNSKFDEKVAERAKEIAGEESRNAGAKGIQLTPLDRRFEDDGSVNYSLVEVHVDREKGIATIMITGPDGDAPASVDALHEQARPPGSSAWRGSWTMPFCICVSTNLRIGVVVFKSQGDPARVVEHEKFLLDNKDSDWLSREILLYWKRVLKRIDLTSRSLVAMIENGSALPVSWQKSCLPATAAT